MSALSKSWVDAAPLKNAVVDGSSPPMAMST
jgi:hypothetical protein